MAAHNIAVKRTYTHAHTKNGHIWTVMYQCKTHHTVSRDTPRLGLGSVTCDLLSDNSFSVGLYIECMSLCVYAVKILLLVPLSLRIFM